MNELVSVIVPVYNIEAYLPRCLECIKAQSYTNLEIILVDDGSTDSSGKICDEYAVSDSRARVIHHDHNIGHWAARNTGQDAATGEYLWFSDGDDYFHRDIIKAMCEAINQTTASGEKYDVAFVGYKRTNHFDEDVISDVHPTFSEISLEEVLEAFVRPTEHFTGRNVWNKLYRKDFINDIRTGNYKYAQDCDFSLKTYLKSPRVILVNQFMYYWMDRPSSTMCSHNYSFESKLCVVHILYSSLTNTCTRSGIYRKYILEFLYINMALLLDMVQGTDRLYMTRREFKSIVNHTWIAYLKCNKIATFKKRLSRMLKIRFDKLYRFVYE
jgi:glycosyltransferase involved in cell wall biosynthesis